MDFQDEMSIWSKMISAFEVLSGCWNSDEAESTCLLKKCFLTNYWLKKLLVMKIYFLSKKTFGEAINETIDVVIGVALGKPWTNV